MTDFDDINSYDYPLAPERIALHPPADRAGGRLMVVQADRTVDAHVRDLVTLDPGDLLVFNETRVLPARLQLWRTTGAKLELLVTGLGNEGRWDEPRGPICGLLRGRASLRPGEQLTTAAGRRIELLSRGERGAWTMQYDGDALSLIHAEGLPPLPPYIRAGRRAAGEPEAQPADAERYQTRFARTVGAVAAPTAGLHLDDAMLTALAAKGIESAAVLLHVGIGTFRPVETARLSEHRMHAEWYDVPQSTLQRVDETRARARRVIAIGTTVVRALESARAFGQLRGETTLLIRPGFRFRCVDLLLTNFHQPKSTLLALVSAFAGYETIRSAYSRALEADYRFCRTATRCCSRGL